MSYEKWSFGYWCLKQYIIFADWLINKKTFITGLDNIPKNKPVVFAPNHQNALSDPMAVLLNTPFQPVWLARADIFGKSKVIDNILKFLKIMPVYRIRDGKSNLDKNEITFADSVKVLKNNGALALFPEAAHSGKRQMLAHKKAVPRIVFMAEEKTDNNLDIQIIPTGIYYSHYWKFNRFVIVNFGKPVTVKNYLKQYYENPTATILELKSEIHDSIIPLILNINSKKYYQDFENIREIYGDHFLARNNKKKTLLNRFTTDQKLVEKLDKLELSSPEQAEELTYILGDYLHEIKKLKLRSWLLEDKKNVLLLIIINILILIAGLPLFIFGFIFNAIPFLIIDRVIRKKIRDKSFWSTFFLMSGIILFPLLYIIQLFALSCLIPGLWLKIAVLVLMPLSGKLAFRWYITLRKTIGLFRVLYLKYFKTLTYKHLLTLKDRLYKKLDNIISVN